jgi:predicted nucleotidyltransferase
MLRIRDFLETYDDLIFAVVSYNHPPEGYLAFLRYYPCKSGGRMRGDKGFMKTASTEESFDFLEKNFPGYVHPLKTANARLQCVPHDNVRIVYHPIDRLGKILSKPRDELEDKAKKIAELLDFLPDDKTGVTGSLLVGLHNPGSSDIDFVVYGLKNYEEARMFLKESFQKNNAIRPLDNSEWKAAYKKRFPVQKTLSFDDFLWHEKRKYHKGVIDGTIFDILLVRDFDEIKEYKKRVFKRYNKVKIRCHVMDSSLAFDSPAVYKVQCGEDVCLTDVVSYTHTYAGQAFDGEEIEVTGFFEKSLDDDMHRVVVGTTREAVGEYIMVVRGKKM